MGGAYNPHGRDDKRIQNIGGKPEGSRPLRRSRHRWEDNIKTDLQIQCMSVQGLDFCCLE
jgi:hypothetical protein